MILMQQITYGINRKTINIIDASQNGNKHEIYVEQICCSIYYSFVLMLICGASTHIALIIIFMEEDQIVRGPLDFASDLY